MLPVLVAVGIVWGFTYAGVKWSENPTRKEDGERKKLASLLAKPEGELTLDEAEDGLVLSRRFSERGFTKFLRVRDRLKKTRVKI